MTLTWPWLSFLPSRQRWAQLLRVRHADCGQYGARSQTAEVLLYACGNLLRVIAHGYRYSFIVRLHHAFDYVLAAASNSIGASRSHDKVPYIVVSLTHIGLLA